MLPQKAPVQNLYWPYFPPSVLVLGVVPHQIARQQDRRALKIVVPHATRLH